MTKRSKPDCARVRCTIYDIAVDACTSEEYTMACRERLSHRLGRLRERWRIATGVLSARRSRAGETLCAFLIGEGRRVLIGVGPDDRIVSRQVADIWLRDIAVMLGRDGLWHWRAGAAPLEGDAHGRNCCALRP